MPVVNLKEVLDKAIKHDYAVGAFNVHNLEFVEGVMRAAEALALQSWRDWDPELIGMRMRPLRFYRAIVISCSPIKGILRSTGNFTIDFIAISMKK
jgi:hypothetical protein